MGDLSHGTSDVRKRLGWVTHIVGLPVLTLYSPENACLQLGTAARGGNFLLSAVRAFGKPRRMEAQLERTRDVYGLSQQAYG